MILQKFIKSVKFIDLKTDFSKIHEAVTFVNADIEGNELDFIKSIKNIIVKDRPVLAISAYHLASDLVDLPSEINSYVNNYAYILRKYDGSVGSINRASELVLYAIPEERLAL